jgi:glycopeptide antibiotics resistance protein
MMAVIVPGLAAYEFAQGLIHDSTFDWQDIVATLAGGLISALVYLIVHPASPKAAAGAHARTDRSPDRLLHLIRRHA